MNTPLLDPQSPLCDALCGLLLSLVIGPWLTVGGLRVLQDPSRVEEKSLINWPVRWSARGAQTERQIRFWAFMALLGGVLGDFSALLMLWALIDAIVKAMLAH